jgi:RNA polymerase sigma factor (sigma-70 family)
MEGTPNKARSSVPSTDGSNHSLSDAGPAYEKYKPLLFSALAHLARQGYVAPASDGLDLVHDFFLEAWAGLEKRYDSSKGSFGTYLFAAFTRFARPRIVKCVRWQQNLYGPEELIQLTQGTTREATVTEMNLDLQLIKRALGSLTGEERQVLSTALTSGLSERAAARRLGTSRYKLRQKSAEALARLASAINEPEPLANQNWQVARALWLEDRNFAEVTRSLNLTASQTRSIRRRVLKTLASAISVEQSGTYSEANMATDLCSLWNRLVSNPKDPEILSEVRRLRAELADHLEDCPACLTAAEKADNPGDLYSALATSEEELSAEDSKVREELLRARADDNSAVERAIVDALLPSLPRGLATQWNVERGVTPLTLFRSINSVSMLVEDLIRRNRPSVPPELTAWGEVFLNEKAAIKRDVVLGEIREVAKVHAETAGRLFDWVFAAARSNPKLFPSLDSWPHGPDRIRLVLVRRPRVLDLFERWSPQVVRMLSGFKESADEVASAGSGPPRTRER